MDISSIVKGEVAQTCAIPVSEIKDETNLVEYGMDSVRSLELVAALESQFNIAIKDSDIADFCTVGDVIRAVERTVKA